MDILSVPYELAFQGILMKWKFHLLLSLGFDGVSVKSVEVTLTKSAMIRLTSTNFEKNQKVENYNFSMKKFYV